MIVGPWSSGHARFGLLARMNAMWSRRAALRGRWFAHGNAGVSADAALGDTIRGVTMTQPWPAPAPARTRTWPIAALAIMAVVLAAAALIVALTRSGSSSGPTYTAAQKAAATTKLCDQYKLASRALHIETTTPDNTALARIAMSNGALMLETSAANPALDPRYRDAAQALAAAYQTTAAIGTTGMATREQYLASVDDSNVKDAAMKAFCSD